MKNVEMNGDILSIKVDVTKEFGRRHREKPLSLLQRKGIFLFPIRMT